MKASKTTTQTAAPDLNGRIDKAVALTQQLEALKEQLDGERAAIKDAMERAGLTRYATDTANEAVIIEKEIFSWSVDKLADVLEEDDFLELCPRKAEGAKLRKRFDSEAAFNTLVKKCFKKTLQHPLEIRAAGAVAERKNEVAAEREAA